MIPHQPRSILIVEDERIVAKDLQQTLQELGYDAFAIASSAEEAISHASEKCPDLVLMDIRIKGRLDGIETAEILKNRFCVPVVYLTAHADEGTLSRAKKTEPHGYLVKPVKPAELRSVVEVALYRHEMETRLRERERWFSTTLRSIADAVITVDLSGKVTFMNPTAEALTGTTSVAALGKPIHEVIRLVDEQASGDDTPVMRALREGHSVDLQEGNLLNLSSGVLRLINDSAAPVIDEKENRTLGAVMVFRDVTEHRKMQTQLELADRLASLGTMAAGVAHEVNNPLAVVVANSGFLSSGLEALRSSEIVGEARQQLDEMQQALIDLDSAASRIGRIVSDLRAFTTPRRHRPGSIDVAPCIQWAIRTTAHELRHRAKLVTDLAAVPLVTADETRLGQVLINLLINAAQAIVPGNADGNEVSIRTRVEHGDHVVIEVRDTGSGIPKDAVNRIFEPFFTTKPIGIGTGLGLSICHGIVSSFGGQIQVDSEVGHGTTVRILLPVGTNESLTPTASAKPATSHRGHILVVDDEDMVLRALSRLLQDHEVCCVDSGQKALALIEQGRWFDLILSDLTMPNMTGIEFYEKLLNTKPEIARRIVFLSGGATTARVEDFLRTVPNPQIEKPFEVGRLQQTVQRLLAQYSGESEVTGGP